MNKGRQLSQTCDLKSLKQIILGLDSGCFTGSEWWPANSLYYNHCPDQGWNLTACLSLGYLMVTNLQMTPWPLQAAPSLWASSLSHSVSVSRAAYPCLSW